MGYMHIDNLYKNQEILTHKRCYALEKVHGTSAHISFNIDRDPRVCFFSGGEKHERFVDLFDQQQLHDRFITLGCKIVTVYGEAYGGSQQRMRETYGDDLRFIVFDVKVGDNWVPVPDAAAFASMLGLEFVPFVEISTDLAEVDRECDAPSVVAQRRGCGGDKRREGIVLRPIDETLNHRGQRVIAKHKCAEFSERVTPPKIVDPSKALALVAAEEIAQEWVTPMRLLHVIDHIKATGVELDIAATGAVVRGMIEDVTREASGEIVDSKEARSAIGRRAAALFKDWLKSSL